MVFFEQIWKFQRVTFIKVHFDASQMLENFGANDLSSISAGPRSRFY